MQYIILSAYKIYAEIINMDTRVQYIILKIMSHFLTENQYHKKNNVCYCLLLFSLFYDRRLPSLNVDHRALCHIYRRPTTIVGCHLLNVDHRAPCHIYRRPSTIDHRYIAQKSSNCSYYILNHRGSAAP